MIRTSDLNMAAKLASLLVKRNKIFRMECGGLGCVEFETYGEDDAWIKRCFSSDKLREIE